MFNIYPIINYNDDKIIDISKRFVITNIETNLSKDIYFWYTIKNWKSPENIAYDFYGSCDYVWVILTLNNIINPFNDWLFSDEEIKKIINEKYGSKLYDVHHYEQNGILYKERPSELEGYPTKIITNYDYEIQENEKKRKIKILYPHLLQQIENEVKALFI